MILMRSLMGWTCPPCNSGQKADKMKIYVMSNIQMKCNHKLSNIKKNWGFV